MSKFLLTTTLLISLSMPFGAKPIVIANVSDIPFSFENGLVIVEAKIKGGVPVDVVLATGTEYSIIDGAMLDKYKLPAYYAADGPVTGRNDSTYSYTKVSSVSVGDSKSKELDMRFGSMAQVSQAAGREIFAALGADFFDGQIVQFDFKKKTLRFLDKSPADAGKDKNTSSAASTSVVLRMAEKVSNPFKRTFAVPIVGDVTFNGQKAKLLLDTGRSTSLAFATSAAKKAGFTLPEEKGEPRADKVASLRLDTYEMVDVLVMIYAKGTGAEQSLSKYGVVAGTKFLQNFIATFDFRNKVVVLEPV